MQTTINCLHQLLGLNFKDAITLLQSAATDTGTYTVSENLRKTIYSQAFN